MSSVKYIRKLQVKLPNEIWCLIKDYTINNTKYIINNKLKFPSINTCFKFKYTIIDIPLKNKYIFKKYIYDKKIMFSFINDKSARIHHYYV